MAAPIFFTFYSYPYLPYIPVEGGNIHFLLKKAVLIITHVTCFLPPVHAETFEKIDGFATNCPDCDRSVEILQISYDVSLGKIVMSKWSGTVRDTYLPFEISISEGFFCNPQIVIVRFYVALI